MQPTHGQSHVNRPLTNIAVAYIQDQSEFVADQLFPIVPVDNKSDSYYKYEKDSFARAIAETREGAEEARRSGWKTSTDDYNCKQKSFAHDVPSDIAGNTDMPLDPYRDATEFVTRAMLIKRESDVATRYFAAGVWTNETASVAAADKWDNYSSSDPFTDIKAKIRVVQKASLVKPNILVLGPTVFDSLQNHPELKDRYKYTSSESITTAVLATLFGLKKVIVAEAVGATSPEGDTLTTDYVFGKHALLAYAAPRPSILAPSAGYIFNWKAYGNNFGARIRQYPMQHLNNSQRVEGDMAYDAKVVCADAAYFWGSVVS
jgi:major capsid protein E